MMVPDERLAPERFDQPEPLFDVEPVPVQPDQRTTGERRRARQLVAVTTGQHPLSVALRYPIALHPQARRDGDRTAPGTPRCGGCEFRRQMSGAHNGTFPKCAADAQPQSKTWPDGRKFTWNEYPRATNGPGTDVAAWWPACRDFEAKAAGS